MELHRVPLFLRFGILLLAVLFLYYRDSEDSQHNRLRRRLDHGILQTEYQGRTSGRRRLGAEGDVHRYTSDMAKWLKDSGQGKLYDTYIGTQSKKLTMFLPKILVIDRERQKQVVQEMRQVIGSQTAGITTWHRKTVLCLGARLGGEVRAFKELGAIALGIDLNPGEASMEVLAGDFHHIMFPDGSFDYLFSNVLDHVFSDDMLATEAHRVLAPGGIFMASVFPDVSDRWNGREGVSIENRDKFAALMAKKGFVLKTETEMEYVIEFPPELHKNPWNNRILTMFFEKQE